MYTKQKSLKTTTNSLALKVTMQDASPLVLFGKKAWQVYVRLLARQARKPGLRRVYALTCLLILVGTTCFWAVLSARLQAHNADQLSDPYLFSSLHTFHAAVFPSAHTFLIKWPLFLLVATFGVINMSLLVVTVGLTLVTVLCFVFVLYKIDRRPLVFGTVCLALSLAFLLIPAQAYPGGLLPVNMAMLTTRNLEYVVYLLALVCFAKTGRLRSWNFVFGVVLLALLIASDKLFAVLSVGGALLAIGVYALRRNKELVKQISIWLVGSLFAVIAATTLLTLIDKTGFTHISGAAASPYGVTHGSKNLVLGISYAALSLLTNAGANPVYDNRLLGDLPGSLVHRLWSLTSFVYVVALCVFLYTLWAGWSLLRRSLSGPKQKTSFGVASVLAYQLMWSSVAAAGVFVLSNHYYAVDSRYLTIVLFALAVSTVVWLRSKQWRWPEDLLFIGSTLVVAIIIALGVAARISDQQNQALIMLEQRNTLVAQTLKHHKVDVLVGDYWRVLPVKKASAGAIRALPLATCTQPTAALTSGAWQPDLKKHSFAYLITLDGNTLTNFPQCTLAQVAATYGQPNAIQVITGTPTHPAEALLFYDQGAHPGQTSKVLTPILPIGLSDLQDTDCGDSTVMNVVAHEDDDLLFLSPDLLHDVQSHKCVRTVFLTAGDSGYGKFYWLSRQLGAEAAYSTMLGDKTPAWNQQIVTLAPHEYLTIATPRDHPNVSLIFFNLPDGGLQGQGFASSDHQSLASLFAGDLSKITSVDGVSTYNSNQLTVALTALMNVYTPSVVHTQADVVDDTYPDHSDHIATGLYVTAAARMYAQQQFGDPGVVPLVFYIGYPIHGYQDNLLPDDVIQKEAAFLAYAEHDGGVCHSIDQCAETPTYSAYIPRQYTEDASQP
jgi:LmbE family N-acetylglucosaminyl deacetylase